MITNSNSSSEVRFDLQQPKPKKNNWFLSSLIWISVILLIVALVFVGWYSSKNGFKPFSSSSITQSSFQSPLSKNNLGPVNFAIDKNAMTAAEVVTSNLDSVLSINIISKLDGKASAGTGYIVSSDGLVITNKHVVALACKYSPSDMQIKAFASDNIEYNLELKSIDPVDDIAILKITNNKSGELKKTELGDSTKLQLGEDVIAIGNALGNLQNTVTKGVVSGIDRSFEALSLKDECTNNEFRVDNLIQTDAAINKGNSGGPLFNSMGQVIGMNTLGTSDAQGVGLAIPSATILTVLNSYLKNNSIIRPRLGVISQEINPLKKTQYPWLPTDYGEFIGSLDSYIDESKVVSSGSTASEAGIEYGDIILELNGEKIKSKKLNPNPLRRTILNLQAGDNVEITYLKANKSSNSSTSKITYDSTPKKITTKLKGVGFDLSKNKMFVSTL